MTAMPARSAAEYFQDDEDNDGEPQPATEKPYQQGPAGGRPTPNCHRRGARAAAMMRGFVCDFGHTMLLLWANTTHAERMQRVCRGSLGRNRKTPPMSGGVRC